MSGKKPVSIFNLPDTPPVARDRGLRTNFFAPTTSSSEAEPIVQRTPVIIPFELPPVPAIPPIPFCDFIKGAYQRTIVKKQVGAGGSARVYSIEYSGQPYLVREIRGKSYDDFQRECTILYSLQHSPYVMKVYGACYLDLVGYMLLEFVPGRTMMRWLEEGTTRANPDERVRVYRELIQGLKTIHEAGFVHLDINPANIWIPIDLSRPPFYIDFDLAQPANTEITSVIRNSGTKTYLPPEVDSLATLKQRNYWALGRVIGQFDNFSFPSGKAGLDFGHVDYKIPTEETPISSVVKKLQTSEIVDFNALLHEVSQAAVPSRLGGGAAGEKVDTNVLVGLSNLPENVMGPRRPKVAANTRRTRRNKKLTRRHRRA